MRINKKSPRKKPINIQKRNLQTDKPPETWELAQSHLLEISELEDKYQYPLDFKPLFVEKNTEANDRNLSSRNAHTSNNTCRKTLSSQRQINKRNSLQTNINEPISFRIVKGNSVFVRCVNTLQSPKRNVLPSVTNRRHSNEKTPNSKIKFKANQSLDKNQQINQRLSHKILYTTMNQTSPSLRWNQFFMDLLTEKKKKETSII